MTTRWLGLAFIFSIQAAAKTVQNSYIRFDIPDNWHCASEQTAWVCSPANPGDAREALIVTTAKVAGPEDNLKSFSSYLSQPKTLITKSKSTLSQPLSLNRRTIDGLNWVEAVHLSSEVPNFTTKYLATVKSRLAVLVSFSADRDNLDKYKAVFENAARSIQVDASKATIEKIQQALNPRIPLPTDNLNGSQTAPNSANVNQALHPPPNRSRKLVQLLLITAAGIIVVLIIRKLV